MEKVIVGIEVGIPYEFQGRKGTTNRFYLLDKESTVYTKNNGSYFNGQKTEYIKVPSSVDVNQFSLGDIIHCYYNRYGNIEEIVKV